jgi:hypothetical protein
MRIRVLIRIRIRNTANKLNKPLVFLTNAINKLFLVRRWGRPPLPELDAAKDALIFQQLELDHYIGELLP